MTNISVDLIAEGIKKSIDRISCEVEPSCAKAVAAARDGEKNATTRFALDVMCKNIEYAKAAHLPVCQDTGMVVVFIKIGQDVRLTGGFIDDAVNGAVREAFLPLRKSVLDPVSRVNTKDNTPAVIHTKIVKGDSVEVEIMLKGFGSENMSRVYMLKPAQGVEGITDAIVETVKIAGSRPCPPVICGVGIGGTFDTCTYLAKKALTRDIGTHSEREDIAEIERRALEKINALGIGCQGFHGDVTALGVNCEWAPTHIAGLPVAINIQCHCMRCRKEVL